MLRLLRVVLPAWEMGQNLKQQEHLIGQLFTLLGEVLVLCSSPFVRPSRTGQSSRFLCSLYHSTSLAGNVNSGTCSLIPRICINSSVKCGS